MSAQFSVRLSKHAEARIQQRGIRVRDVDILMRWGRHCAGGIALTRQDQERAICFMRLEIERLEKLGGQFFAISQDGMVKTGFRLRKEQFRMKVSKRRLGN
jgi:hypothetical protein